MNNDGHLDEQAWASLLDGSQAPKEVARNLLHVAFCGACRRRAPAGGAELLQRAFGEYKPKVDGRSHERWQAEPLLQNALVRMEAQMERAIEEMAVAPDLWAELQEHPWQRREWMVVNATKFQQCGLVFHLLAASRDCWHQDANEAYLRARLALTILGELSTATYPSALLFDCEARAHAYCGNGLRLRGDLGAAEAAFEAAWRASSQGSGCLEEEAWICALQASHRREQQRYEDALALNRTAMTLFQKLGDQKEYLAAKILRAYIYGETRQTVKAIETLRAVLAQASQLTLPLHLAALEGLSNWLLEAGRPISALFELPHLRSLSAQSGWPTSEIRIDWLEGQVWAALGDKDAAEARFREVQEAFLERGMAYDAALAALDRAVILLEEDKTAEARELAAELVPVFQSREIHREATAALLIFAEAARKEAATAGLAREVAEFLKQARHNLDLQFKPFTDDAEGGEKA